MKSDVTVYLMGGLGNNLFQYNFGEYLKKSCDLNVSYNRFLCSQNFITRYKRFTIHEFSLPLLLEGVNTKTRFHPSIILGGMKLNMLGCSWMDGCDIPSARHLFGYFQDLQFHSRNLCIELQPSAVGACANEFDWIIHLRFGDAPNPSENLAYYRSALERIGRKKSILAVTDDKIKSSELLSQYSDCYMVQRLGVVEDFYTLAGARALVVAPSTFSWWASRLGSAKETILPTTFQ